MTATDSAGSAFGANSWLVEEMYEQFRSDPGSVSETWQEFFSDYKPSVPVPALPPPPAAAADPSNGAAPAAVRPAAAVAADLGDPIRGAGAAIAANMERSL
ncbi:MAG: hypothetical protein ABIZ69_07420, partial [Ilumatobacteraceae bacterium]